MKSLVTMLLALGLAAPLATPTFAQDEAPTDQAACEDSGGTWNPDDQSCL